MESAWNIYAYFIASGAAFEVALSGMLVLIILPPHSTSPLIFNASDPLNSCQPPLTTYTLTPTLTIILHHQHPQYTPIRSTTKTDIAIIGYAHQGHVFTHARWVILMSSCPHALLHSCTHALMPFNIPSTYNTRFRSISHALSRPYSSTLLLHLTTFLTAIPTYPLKLFNNHILTQTVIHPPQTVTHPH